MPTKVVKAAEVSRPSVKTLTKLSKGELQKPKRRRSPGKSSTSRSSKIVTWKKFNPEDHWNEVVEKVLELSGGDLSRVEQISVNNVIIHNPGWVERKKRK